MHKNKYVNKNLSTNRTKLRPSIGSWEEAIRAMESLLLRVQVREREVNSMLRLFKAKKNAGEPWPGDNAIRALGEY